MIPAGGILKQFTTIEIASRMETARAVRRGEGGNGSSLVSTVFVPEDEKICICYVQVRTGCSL